MFAVIRAGGKQYRVAPGDVIRVEKIAPGNGRDAGQVEFTEVLAVSGEQGSIAKPQAEARVTGQVVAEGRAEKILVFHYKRKKQYKRLRGHRQPFTEVRITEIAFDGKKFSAPALEKRVPRAARKAAASASKASTAGELKAAATAEAQALTGKARVKAKAKAARAAAAKRKK
jgi:large subunit ribosomal protein L21